MSPQQPTPTDLFGAFTGATASVPAALAPLAPAPVAPAPPSTGTGTGTGADAVPTGLTGLTGLADLAAVLGLADPAQVHAGVPQAQGDVLVWPWPADQAPTARDRAVRGARPVPRAGRVVLRGRGGHTHTLLPDGPDVTVAPDDLGGALAVLVVAAGSVAVLAHEQHPDLHIGEGVYLLRRQRRHIPDHPDTGEYVED